MIKLKPKGNKCIQRCCESAENEAQLICIWTENNHVCSQTAFEALTDGIRIGVLSTRVLTWFYASLSPAEMEIQEQRHM